MLRLAGRLGLDFFLLGLLSMVGLAWAFPDLGRSDGPLRLDLVATYGVALVFLLYGLTLPPERLKAGVLNWRLHLVVHLSTFVLFPVLVWGGLAVFGGGLDPDLALGLLYLGALPSTISSSVAMTSIARGNVAGAVFNASLSSLIGVVLTPLWVNAYLASSGAALDLGQVLTKLALLVVLPIGLGQGLRPWLAAWAASRPRTLKAADRITILLIVLNSFSDSMVDGVWIGHGPGLLVMVGALSLGLFFGVYGLLGLVCRAWGFSRADTIAARFCGTKKSLAAGVPMAKIMFGASPALGMVILPIILYHLLQLIVAGILARRLGRDDPA